MKEGIDMKTFKSYFLNKTLYSSTKIKPIMSNQAMRLLAGVLTVSLFYPLVGYWMMAVVKNVVGQEVSLFHA